MLKQAATGVSNLQILRAVLGRAQNDEEVAVLLNKIHNLQKNVAKAHGDKYYNTVLGAPVYKHHGFKSLNLAEADNALASTIIDVPKRLIDTKMDRAAATRALTFQQLKHINNRVTPELRLSLPTKPYGI